jgi:hypothetical protein
MTCVAARNLLCCRMGEPDPKPFDVQAAIARNLVLFEQAEAQIAAVTQWVLDMEAAQRRRQGRPRLQVIRGDKGDHHNGRQ